MSHRTEGTRQVASSSDAQESLAVLRAELHTATEHLDRPALEAVLTLVQGYRRAERYSDPEQAGRDASDDLILGYASDGAPVRYSDLEASSARMKKGEDKGVPLTDFLAEFKPR